MPTLSTTIRRLELNQSSLVPTKEQLSGDKLVLWQGASANIQCALFIDTPNADTLVSVTNLNSATLTARKNGPNGVILFSKDVFSFTSVSYATWRAGSGSQFVFNLSELDTTQIVPDSGHLTIYFTVTVITDDAVPYIAGFGYGEIQDVGYIENPVLADYVTGRTPIIGGKLLTDLDVNGHHFVDSATGGYIEEGATGLTGGQTLLTIPFQYTKPDADGYRFEYLYIVDSVTGEPSDGIPKIKSQSTTNFVVRFTQGAQAASILYWKTAPKFDVVIPEPELHYTPLPAIGDTVCWAINDMGGQFFNVLAYDIFGDGVIDNKDKIDELLTLVEDAGGGIIFFPPGNYKTSANHVIENDNITIMGAGYCSRITNTHASNVTFQLGSTTGGANSTQVLNLLFQPSVTRSANTFEIVSHSANNIKLDELTFNNVWGGISLGRIDALYGNAKINGITATNFHKILYAVRFQDIQCSGWVLGAIQSDAIAIDIDGGCDSGTYTAIDSTNGGAMNVKIHATAYNVPSRFHKFIGCNFDHSTVSIRQDTGDHNSIIGCFLHAVVINGGANTSLTTCELFNPGTDGIKIFGGGAVTITDCKVRNAQGDAIQILNDFVGGCNIVGGTIAGSTGNGIFIATGVENVVVSNETIFDSNATDVTNNSTSPTVRLPDKYIKWRSLTLSNSWTNIGAPYFLAQYGIRHDGRVELRGTIHNGTFTYPTIFAAFPSSTGWVPASNVTRPVEFGNGVGVIQIGADGNLRVWVPGPDHDAITLDGLSFLPA